MKMVEDIPTPPKPAMHYNPYNPQKDCDLWVGAKQV